MLATQPVVALTGQMPTPLYAECLARLMVARSIVLTADDFVGSFEDQGLIATLDRAVIRMALDALAVDPTLRLGCNISPLTLSSEAHWQPVRTLLERRPDCARRIYLEITETFPLEDVMGAADRLAEAKRAGCRLVIDDFGSGYATSEYLHGVDVDWDVVKIDRTLMPVATNARSALAPFRSQLSLASALAPLVVVEGIESRFQRDLAIEQGVAYGQGWWFAEPMLQGWYDAGQPEERDLSAVFVRQARKHPGSARRRILANTGGAAKAGFGPATTAEDVRATA